MRALRRIPLLLAIFSVLPLLAHAHPGHEGHDLTWDFAAGLGHPLAPWGFVLVAVLVGLAIMALGDRIRAHRASRRLSRRRD